MFEQKCTGKTQCKGKDQEISTNSMRVLIFGWEKGLYLIARAAKLNATQHNLEEEVCSNGFKRDFSTYFYFAVYFGHIHSVHGTRWSSSSMVHGYRLITVLMLGLRICKPSNRYKLTGWSGVGCGLSGVSCCSCSFAAAAPDFSPKINATSKQFSLLPYT